MTGGGGNGSVKHVLPHHLFAISQTEGDKEGDHLLHHGRRVVGAQLSQCQGDARPWLPEIYRLLDNSPIFVHHSW